MIDKLWELHLESIPDYKGKIWVNQTAGLDSRVLGGIISKRRQIDFGFYYYYKESEHNVKHVKKIVSLLNYKNFKFIKLDRFGYGGFDHAVKIITEGYHPELYPVDLVKLAIDINPSEYTYIVNSYGDAVSGRFKTKKRERKFFDEVYSKETHLPFTNFKSIEFPLWNPRLLGYFYSMPRYQRWFQHGYMMMIKKYLPELYEVPRCFEQGYKPVKMDMFYLPRAAWSKYR